MSFELAYFYNSEAEQYSFYRIPKVLLTDQRYKGVAIMHHKAQAKAHIIPALGKIPLSRLDPHRIQSFYNSLHRGSGEKQPLIPKSIRNVSTPI